MSSEYKQDTRVCVLSTPLPPNTLVLSEFSGEEHINSISTYQVRALSQKVIDMDALLGNPMTVSINLPNGETRHINLICFSARYLGFQGEGHSYQFELKPKFWIMSYRTNSRIFENMSISDILQTLLGGYGIIYKMQAPTLSDMREYVVQFNETDLAFCRRLMEKMGVSFYVEMTDRSHSLIITDTPADCPTAPSAKARFWPSDGAQHSPEAVLTSWSPHTQFTTHAHRLRDFDFLQPTAETEGRHSIAVTEGQPEFEYFYYPGGFHDRPGTSGVVAKGRHIGMRTGDKLVQADSRQAFFGAAMKFELSTHEDEPKQKGKYVVLSAYTHFSALGYRSGGGGSEGFSSHYILTREDNPIGPSRVTPLPNIPGPQTAIVVEGAEGSIDKHGRIWVKFHWEPNARSMPCRVAQMWSGNAWGTVFIPRVGMEVVVEFINGDPDQPLITGCVYNGKNAPPWPLPGDKTRSGIKSQTMGGGGYNEISLDDKSGNEQIRIHAQKDMETTVENDETVTIRRDSTRKVERDQKIDVMGTETTTVMKACTVESMETITLKVGGNSIELSQSGIKIAGLQIEVNASAMLKTNGTMAEHKGTLMTLQAPIIKIN